MSIIINERKPMTPKMAVYLVLKNMRSTQAETTKRLITKYNNDLFS